MSSDWDRKNTEACKDADGHFAYGVIADSALCGCGSRDEFIAEILNVLRACPLRHLWYPSDEGFGQLGGELLLHVMDAAGLIEHGTSVGGSWITEKGTRFLAVMDGKPDDWLDNVGYACSLCPEASA